MKPHSPKGKEEQKGEDVGTTQKGGEVKTAPNKQHHATHQRAEVVANVVLFLIPFAWCCCLLSPSSPLLGGYSSSFSPFFSPFSTFHLQFLFFCPCFAFFLSLFSFFFFSCFFFFSFFFLIFFMYFLFPIFSLFLFFLCFVTFSFSLFFLFLLSFLFCFSCVFLCFSYLFFFQGAQHLNFSASVASRFLVTLLSPFFFLSFSFFLLFYCLF